MTIFVRVFVRVTVRWDVIIGVDERRCLAILQVIGVEELTVN